MSIIKLNLLVKFYSKDKQTAYYPQTVFSRIIQQLIIIHS